MKIKAQNPADMSTSRIVGAIESEIIKHHTRGSGLNSALKLYTLMYEAYERGVLTKAVAHALNRLDESEVSFDTDVTNTVECGHTVVDTWSGNMMNVIDVETYITDTDIDMYLELQSPHDPDMCTTRHINDVTVE